MSIKTHLPVCLLCYDLSCWNKSDGRFVLKRFLFQSQFLLKFSIKSFLLLFFFRISYLKCPIQVEFIFFVLICSPFFKAPPWNFNSKAYNDIKNYKISSFNRGLSII